MVIDTLDNLEKYVSMNPLFKEVVDFIKANDLNSLEIGKHEINGADLFVNVQKAKGKTKEAAMLETHKKMIDIQIPLSGEETYGYTPLCGLPDAYSNSVKGFTQYAGMADTSATCNPGESSIFFSQVGPAPCIPAASEI